MRIWKSYKNLEDWNQLGQKTIHESLGIEVLEIGDDYLKGKMPVNDKTKQPYGILHGGASVVLAESLGSMAADMVIDNSIQYCVGLDVNANHIRAVKSGWVYGTAIPIHLGRKTQVWSIEIVDEEGKKVCISRLTMAVLEKPK